MSCWARLLGCVLKADDTQERLVGQVLQDIKKDVFRGAQHVLIVRNDGTVVQALPAKAPDEAEVGDLASSLKIAGDQLGRVVGSISRSCPAMHVQGVATMLSTYQVNATFLVAILSQIQDNTSVETSRFDALMRSKIEQLNILLQAPSQAV